MKTCIKCKEAKDVTEFGKDVKRRDKLNVYCKVCKHASDVKWRASNRDKYNAASAKYYAANKDKCKASSAKWAKKNPRVHLYRKAYKADYYLKNKEKIKSQRAVSYLSNREKVIAAVAAYRKANPDKVKAMFATWYASNQEKINIYSHNRRARKRSSGGKLSKDIAARLYKLQKGRCVCCKEPLGDDYHLDHIIPLFLGGKNSDENIQLLRAKCNLEKNKKHPIDFMQSRGFLL